MLPADKQIVRQAVKRRVAACDRGVLERESHSLCEHLLAHPALLSARTLMVYAPLNDEVDVRPLAAGWALMASRERERGGTDEGGGPRPPRRLCVPRMNWPDRSMEAVEVVDWDHDLVLSRLGLREPRADLAVVPAAEVDVVIVPGLAFDATGARLGRGAGFYDRFLARLSARTVTIGVAFSVQVVPRVPIETHDVRVRFVATGEGVVRASASA